MSREIKTCRDDAIMLGQTDGSALVRAVVLLEHLTPGRIRSPAPRLELTLQPGTIYCGYTGILLPVIEPLRVRASAEAWKFGLEVLRVDFSTPKGAAPHDSSELVIYFRVSTPAKYQKDMLCFEVSTAHGSLSGVKVSPGMSIPVPGLNLAIEPPTNKKYGEKPQATVAGKTAPEISDAEAAKKVAEWMDSPDPKGHVVSTADTATRPPLPPAAAVQL
jgi:hypothetical protein